jgi:hypothetical protein
MSLDLTATPGTATGHKPPAAPVGIAAAEPARATAWSANHPVNLRLSLPWPGGRIYVTLVAGRERRAPERRAEERRKHPLATKGNILALGIGTVVTGFAILGAIEYTTLWVLRAMTLIAGAN